MAYSISFFRPTTESWNKLRFAFLLWILTINGPKKETNSYTSKSSHHLPKHPMAQVWPQLLTFEAEHIYISMSTMYMYVCFVVLPNSKSHYSCIGYIYYYNNLRACYFFFPFVLCAVSIEYMKIVKCPMGQK